MAEPMSTPWASVVEFWRAAGPGRWFSSDEDFDHRCRAAFLDQHLAAARRELDDWLQSPQGAFGLVLLVDQIPRNAFRGTAHMYATDPLARHFAQRMIDAGFDMQIEADLRGFCYLPFEHSEDIEDQRYAVRLQEPLGAIWTDYAMIHLNVIERFGRFPHRNPLLGRVTTTEEQAFLDRGGFAG